MLITTFDQLTDYRLLDTGQGYRLEQWGNYRLARPDPQAIWERHAAEQEWKHAHAIFESYGEKGSWHINKKMPEFWTINYRSIALKARLTPFKHTGIFAEQAANWDWMLEKLEKPRGRKIKVLNLFGYTGAASVILGKAGHFITHVDASKPSIGWAKENQKLNGLAEDSIRWILDDAAKFVTREVRRGQIYDAIIMDPPAFGHAPSGKVWKFSKDFPKLLNHCVRLLSKDATFLFINAYATNSSPLALNNLLEDAMRKKSGGIENGELCLQQEDGRLISTGIFARWSA